MSTQDSNLKALLSPARSGTFFAPFRSRSANPDGFDSKMRLWINAIEEWAISNRKLIISIKDIQQKFLSNAIRPDKECIRLVFSEMKRRSRLVPLKNLKSSKVWSAKSALIDSYVDPKGWLSWGVKRLVYDPATWAMSAIVSNQDQTYSDLTDLSITDPMRLVVEKSLRELSDNLYVELVRVCKAEKQFCFEWQHLLELITPNLDTIINVTDGKELLEMLELLIEYLTINKKVALLIDNDCKLIKVASPEDTREDNVMITKKDVAIVRLLKAKEMITTDIDKYLNQAQRAKEDAVESYAKKEFTKAKSLLRNHKRMTACAEQKYAQLTNVEDMLYDLERTDSNMMVLQAYKDASEALKIANTHLESNTSILDDMYDVTAEARHLNDEMTQMMKDISCVSQRHHDTELEAELNDIIAANESVSTSRMVAKNEENDQSNLADQSQTEEQHESHIDDHFVDELEQRLNELIVCHDNPNDRLRSVSTPKKSQLGPAETS